MAGWTFKSWYEEHGGGLNEERRNRYKSDPEYRAKVREWNRNSRERKVERRREEREKELDAIKVKLPKIAYGSDVKINVDGKEVGTKIYTLGVLAKALGRAKVTLYKWEKDGLLPKTPFRSPAGDRLYTPEMVLWIREVLEKSGHVSEEKVRSSSGGVKATSRVVSIGEKEVKRMQLFRMGTLAKVVGRTVETLREWEKEGLLPETPLRVEEHGHRYYTSEMIEVVKKVLDEESAALTNGARAGVGPKISKEWKLLGVDKMKVVDVE